jgi:hypothetical protein
MDFNLEIGESNKIQLTELLRLIDKIKFDDVKKMYYASQIVEKEKNIFDYMKYYNFSKEILEKTLKNNYITYENLQKLISVFQYVCLLPNNTHINPIVKSLILFYFYNFLFDIDYILQKKLNHEIDFTGVDFTPYLNVYRNPNIQYTPSEIKIKIKTYLSKFVYHKYSDQEKQNIIDYEKSLVKRDGSNEIILLIPHPFLSQIQINTFKEAPIQYMNGRIDQVDLSDSNGYEPKNKIENPYAYGLYLNLLSLEEQTPILNEIFSDIKKVFNKKIKRENYLIALQEIIQSTKTIDHLDLYEKLNSYLESFGNKEELTKLNNKYKSYLGFISIREKLLKICDILSKVLTKIPHENENLKNIINFVKDFFMREYIDDTHPIIKLDNLKNLLYPFEEMRNLYQASYFDINNNKPIENLEFIINTIYELFDFFIDYININYIYKGRQDMNPPEFWSLKILGGTTNCNKRTLKRY